MLERGQEPADLRRGQLGDVPLEGGEGPRARVVDLDQAPSSTGDHEWHEEHRLHLHLAKDEQLRRIDPRIGGRDRAGEARLQHFGRRRVVGEVVAQPARDLAFGAGVVGNFA